MYEPLVTVDADLRLRASLVFAFDRSLDWSPRADGLLWVAEFRPRPLE